MISAKSSNLRILSFLSLFIFIFSIFAQYDAMPRKIRSHGHAIADPAGPPQHLKVDDAAAAPAELLMQHDITIIPQARQVIIEPRFASKYRDAQVRFVGRVLNSFGHQTIRSRQQAEELRSRESETSHDGRDYLGIAIHNLYLTISCLHCKYSEFSRLSGVPEEWVAHVPATPPFLPKAIKTASRGVLLFELNPQSLLCPRCNSGNDFIAQCSKCSLRMPRMIFEAKLQHPELRKSLCLCSVPMALQPIEQSLTAIKESIDGVKAATTAAKAEIAGVKAEIIRSRAQMQREFSMLTPVEHGLGGTVRMSTPQSSPPPYDRYD